MTTSATRATSATGFKLTISREALREGLAAVAPAVPNKATLPALTNVLLRTTERGLELVGTDLDVRVHSEVAADVDGKGALTIPAKRLVAIAKELPPSPCRLSNGDNKAKLECGHASYRLHALPEEEFPSSLDLEFDNPITIAASDVQALAHLTAFAVSKEDSRPILNGVLLQFEKDVLRFVATNGHRMALAERKIDYRGEPMSDVIVPAKALAHMTRLFSGDYELEIARNGLWFGVRSSTAKVYTRLIEGPYPDYRNVIPTKHEREVIVDRVAFEAAVRRMVPVAPEGTHRIVLDLSTSLLKVRAETADIGDGKDQVPVKFEGAPLVFGANTSYLLEILTRIESDEVRMFVTGAERAIVFKPTDNTRKERALFLLMPLRVVD